MTQPVRNPLPVIPPEVGGNCQTVNMLFNVRMQHHESVTLATKLFYEPNPIEAQLTLYETIFCSIAYGLKDYECDPISALDHHCWHEFIELVTATAVEHMGEYIERLSRGAIPDPTMHYYPFNDTEFYYISRLVEDVLIGLRPIMHSTQFKRLAPMIYEVTYRGPNIVMITFLMDSTDLNNVSMCRG